MQKVRLFAKCFKTWYNCRVWINPNFKLDFFPKVLTNLFKTTSTGDFCFFKLTQPLPVSTVQSMYTVKEKGGKYDRKPYPLPHVLRNPYRNLKSENCQDYAQKPQ